jgi:DNA polymerase-3 subunit gamma/tau
LEEKLAEGVVVSQGPASEAAGNTNGITGAQAGQKPKQPVILPEALPEDLKTAAQNWKSIITQISRKAPSLQVVLNNATLSVDNNQGLLLVVTDEIDKDFIERESHMQVIKDALASLLQKQVAVNVRYLDKSKERLDEVPDLSKLVKMPIKYE